MGIARLLDDQTKLARPKRFWPLVRPSTEAPVTQAVLQNPLISSLSAPRAQDRPPSYVHAVTLPTAFLGSPITTASLVAKVTEDRDRLDARIGRLGAGQPGDTVRRAWTAAGKAPAKLVVALLGDDTNGIDGLMAVLGHAEEVEGIGQLRAAGDPATALIGETWQRAIEGGDPDKVADFLRKLNRPNLVTSALDESNRSRTACGAPAGQPSTSAGASPALGAASPTPRFAVRSRTGSTTRWTGSAGGTHAGRSGSWWRSPSPWRSASTLSAVTIGRPSGTTRPCGPRPRPWRSNRSTDEPRRRPPTSTATTTTTIGSAASTGRTEHAQHGGDGTPGRDTLREIGLPFGWSQRHGPASRSTPRCTCRASCWWRDRRILRRPFWFDALNKLVNLRTTRPPPTADASAEAGRRLRRDVRGRRRCRRPATPVLSGGGRFESRLCVPTQSTGFPQGWSSAVSAVTGGFNHCPYVQHVAAGVAALGRDLTDQGVAMVGISSNDVVTYPQDGPDQMVAGGPPPRLDQAWAFLDCTITQV